MMTTAAHTIRPFIQSLLVDIQQSLTKLLMLLKIHLKQEESLSEIGAIPHVSPSSSIKTVAMEDSVEANDGTVLKKSVKGTRPVHQQSPVR